MNSPLPKFRQNVAALLLVAVCSLPTTGCYTFHAYQAGGPDGRELGNQPSTEWTNTTRHALAWGLIRQDIAVENCTLANGQRLGIDEVKVETNFGYVLISAGTLGFWVPLKVSWRCAKPPVPGGTLE